MGLLDLLMRAQPATEGDVSDSLATAGDSPLLRAFLQLQGQRVRDAVTAPRDAYRGDLQVFDPATGHVTDEAMERANGMAGLAMTGGLAGVGPGGVSVGAGPIRAYHGSPHSFDRFDVSKIGTGEGAQVQGHGLYFTDSQRLAGAYRRADPQRDRGPGHMYEVEINAGPEQLLAWDKPFSQQTPEVQTALRKLGVKEGDSGAAIYEAVGGANALRDAGIPGTTYGRDGNRGYVTFSDDIVEILRKYGIAGLAALGAGSGAVQNLGMMTMPQGSTQ